MPGELVAPSIAVLHRFSPFVLLFSTTQEEARNALPLVNFVFKVEWISHTTAGMLGKYAP